jgi:hypothetical protein
MVGKTIFDRLERIRKGKHTWEDLRTLADYYFRVRAPREQVKVGKTHLAVKGIFHSIYQIKQEVKNANSKRAETKGTNNRS